MVDRSKKLTKKAAWFVRLGPLEWAKFTYERPEGDALKLLGSVKRGLQMGALALNQEGKYVQVVGDFITVLNHAQITRAVAKAEKAEPYPMQKRTMRVVAPAPIVTIKRRRVFVVA
jgi:hypothetical protein